jgi:hypothetical protein
MPVYGGAAPKPPEFISAFFEYTNDILSLSALKSEISTRSETPHFQKVLMAK